MSWGHPQHRPGGRPPFSIVTLLEMAFAMYNASKQLGTSPNPSSQVHLSFLPTFSKYEWLTRIIENLIRYHKNKHTRTRMDIFLIIYHFQFSTKCKRFSSESCWPINCLWKICDAWNILSSVIMMQIRNAKPLFHERKNTLTEGFTKVLIEHNENQPIV